MAHSPMLALVSHEITRRSGTTNDIAVKEHAGLQPTQLHCKTNATSQDACMLFHSDIIDGTSFVVGNVVKRDCPVV